MSVGRNPPQRQKTHLLSWEVVKLWGMTTTHLPTPSQTGFLKHIPLWLSLGHSQWHGCKSPYQGKYINTYNMITVLYYVGFSRLVRKGVEIMQWTIYLTISHTHLPPVIVLPFVHLSLATLEVGTTVHTEFISPIVHLYVYHCIYFSIPHLLCIHIVSLSIDLWRISPASKAPVP